MPYSSENRQSASIIVRVDSDFEDLIPGFLNDWEDEAISMREALTKNDYETIRRLGHNMKGIGGSCGLDVITDMGAGLEKAAKAMDPETIRKNLDSLLCYLERVEFVYT
jgi:HPt (histidine-containing phosphotransfer) domain-containing protein